MKKRICLLLTLIVSIFVGVKSVGAAVELTCIYEGGTTLAASMLSQDSSGNINVYINDNSETSLDSKHWRLSTVDFDFETDKYDSSKKTLNACPNFVSDLSFKSVTLFHDEKKSWLYNNNKLVDSKIGESSDDVAMQSFKYASFHLDEINKEEWIGMCVYAFSDVSKLELYFNDDRYIVANYMAGNTNARFSLNSLMEVVYDTKTCPPFLYLYTTQVINDRVDDVYLFSSERSGIEGDIYGTQFTKSDIPLIDGKVNIDFGSSIVPQDPIDDCHDLFGDELVKQINSIMNWIKILIPILLIGFGIIDFTKAIFAGNEDNMKKAQTTFFNRIIAAILVFIAPIFINLLLSLANEVWGYISPETCIEQSK